MAETAPSLRVETLYNDGELSMAHMLLNGISLATVNWRSATTYRILDSQGTLHIDGRPIAVRSGEQVIIDSGILHWSEGQLEMLATYRPAYRVEDVSRLPPPDL